jgi:hypothetical protein
MAEWTPSPPSERQQDHVQRPPFYNDGTRPSRIRARLPAGTVFDLVRTAKVSHPQTAKIAVDDNSQTSLVISFAGVRSIEIDRTSGYGEK